MPRPDSDRRLIFLDLETSGLDPAGDQILEIGVAVVDSNLGYLTAIGSNENDRTFFQRLPQYLSTIDEILDPRRAPEDLRPNVAYVQQMHQRSGLTEASRAVRRGNHGQATGLSLAQIEKELIAWLADGHGFTPRIGLLAGSSIHFDRSFIRAQMPALHVFLHDRMLDVSGIREAYIRWVEPGFAARWKSETGAVAHRSKEDVIASVNELRFFKDRLFHEA